MGYPILAGPRYVIGGLALLLISFLMWSGTVGETAGMTVIVGVLAALGVYHRRRKSAPDGGGGS